ncbi:hypothetical protein GmHk_01G000895 [Glycine max]|nr:hypothetical protein GmHk_01G000895 [Glycine max]
MRWWWRARGLWSIPLSLSLGAVLLNKSPGDGRPNHLGRCNGDSKRLAESCDQCWKSQGPVGLIWVQRVPSRRHTCKNIDGISNQLSHMDAHPRQDGVHQLTLQQGEVGIMIDEQDVAEQQSHSYLSQGGHVGAHDPHPPFGSSPGKILPRYT